MKSIAIKILKILLKFILIATFSIYMMVTFSSFEKDDAQFIAFWTVVLTYLLPDLQKLYKEYRNKQQA